jgi:hypothetical protein
MELRDSVVFSIVQRVMEFERIGRVYVRLGHVGSAVGKICSVFDFILHTAYTVDACAFTGILPSLSLIDMVYWRADTKVRPASVRGVVVDF